MARVVQFLARVELQDIVGGRTGVGVDGQHEVSPIGVGLGSNGRERTVVTVGEHVVVLLLRDLTGGKPSGEHVHIVAATVVVGTAGHHRLHAQGGEHTVQEKTLVQVGVALPETFRIACSEGIDSHTAVVGTVSAVTWVDVNLDIAETGLASLGNRRFHGLMIGSYHLRQRL